MAHCDHCGEIKTVIRGNICGWCGRNILNQGNNNLHSKTTPGIRISNTAKIKTLSGKEIEYFTEIFASGAMKDAHWSLDQRSVILLYRDKQNKNTRDRLEKIIKDYNPTIDPEVGHYWKTLFCWPEEVLVDGDTIGILVSKYPKTFYIEKGYAKGKEKDGKWFASAKLRKYLDPTEKGDWEKYFRINIKLARSVRKLHALGLAHSDLSYKNILIDPKTGASYMIDNDNLVVPGKFAPDVLGTPDFVAPEVLKTQHLVKEDPNRFLPSRVTDLHALAVLVYMYLLYRHPLKGSKVHDIEPEKDELLTMGEKALFIEHPSDHSNRTKDRNQNEMPWIDTTRMPYTVCGPYLKDLFDRAFIEGLHKPDRRPSAAAWEDALIKTMDLLVPCLNVSCEQKYFVHNFLLKPKCPFCGTIQNTILPVLTFYKPKPATRGQFIEEKYRFVVYHNKPIFVYHADTKYTALEKLKEEEKKQVGYFSFFNGKWLFHNRSLIGLRDIENSKSIPVNSSVELVDGKKLILCDSSTGKLVFIQFPK